MLSELGFYSLVFGLISATLISFKSINLFYQKNIIFPKSLNLIIFFQLFFTVISFLFLTLSFIFSDFGNVTVYNNSHTLKPLFYKISGVWGNHEGSLLLWLLVLTGIIFIFSTNSKNLNSKYIALTIFFQEIIIIGFFLFIIFTSNPFNYLYPIPTEGLGLNPILQDPALAIHPPILYLGYVGTSLIFSSSLSAMINRNLNSKWALHMKKWVSFSWIFLTLGILLGSIWAYYELGWGGFWFWDPVENVSLMPWFCLTALLHSITVLAKRDSLVNWTIILSIATFSLSMSGTFLVRSGILNSIHTFANDPSRGLFILIFLFSIILMAVIIFFFNIDNNQSKIMKYFWRSKETAVLINNWFMMYFLSVVLIGTVYPIFLEVMTNEKISVGPPFFQKLMIPFLIPFLIFMSIAPRLKWIKDESRLINYNQIVIFFITLTISFFVVKFSDLNYLFSTILVSASIYLTGSSFYDLFNNKIKLSQKLSHFSFSVLILSILINGIYSKEINSNMKVGDELEFMDKIIKFKSIEFDTINNYESLLGNFEIKDDKNTINFKPEIRIYNQPVTSTSEADIKTNFFSDNFIVFSLLKDNETFNVRFQYKPFMILIWLSTLTLAIGGMFAAIRK